MDRFWPQVAARVSDWLAAQGLSARDAVVLLPFAQQLAPARRAWMQLGVWQPRIETTHSLAASLGPAGLAEALQISFDPTIDALSAQSLLAQQSWAQALRRQDPRAFELALSRLVEAAQLLLRASHQCAPGARESFWREAREALSTEGPAQLEAALARVALEWSAADGRRAASDALFDLRPSAWVVLQAGGAEPLAEALLSHAAGLGLPSLRLVADVELDHVSHAPALLEQALCRDFEDQAQCAAAAVLEHLRCGRAPVALIAQDRLLLRRVRALLERCGEPMSDETGWTLATLPVAAQLMALLRCAAPQASLDDWLGLLKSELCRPLRERRAPDALPALEALCRRRGWRTPASLRIAELAPSSLSLWRLARSALRQFAEGPAQRSLSEWIEALRQLLRRLEADEIVSDLEGGEMLLDALWLQRQPWPGSAHEHMLQGSIVELSGLLGWVDQVLEAQQYVAKPPEQARVVVTPLARAMLRPFGAIVLPGADARLGAAGAAPALISDRVAQRLGLPTQQARREQGAMAFAQLLRSDALTLLRCEHEGAEPLAASPLLERLEIALACAGLAGASAWQDARIEREVALRPQPRATTSAAGRLPGALSASSIEALRDCPYQFHARVLLRLQEAEELEAPLDKSDYGSWLHALLHQFHLRRGEADDAQLLHRLADELVLRQGLAAAEFLPFSAGFDAFVGRYLIWLAAHEAQGAQFEAGELDRSCQPWAERAHALAGLSLRGRLDRVDRLADGGRLLIDYKTGSLDGLKKRVADPSEDTQLTVYAVLMAQEQGAALRAQYLALDDKAGIAAVVHPDVAHSAAQLLDGLERDLLAIDAGAALPALGEGSACEYCRMRGLCRRDDWSEVAW